MKYILFDVPDVPDFFDVPDFSVYFDHVFDLEIVQQAG